MPVEAVGLTPRGTGLLPGMEAITSAGLCALRLIARVLSTLLGQTVSAERVRDRSMGLGLLRYTEPGEPASLTCQSAARLLLAGYRLPAQIQPGSWEALRAHLHHRLQVFVPLADPGPESDLDGQDEPVLFQVHGCDWQNRDELSLHLGEPDAPMTEVRQWPLQRFVEAWTAADGLLISAARAWSELPPEGPTFFGGHRDRDGTYHWDVAEYVTDHRGQILRC